MDCGWEVSGGEHCSGPFQEHIDFFPHGYTITTICDDRPSSTPTCQYEMDAHEALEHVRHGLNPSWN